MPSSQSSNPAPSNLASLFDAALKEYITKTGVDITTHPLAAKLEHCKSVDAVIDILQDQLYLFKLFRRGLGKRAKLIRTVKPVVDVVLALSTSETLGEGVTMVFPPAKAILGSLGILLGTAKRVSASYDALIDLLGHVNQFLERLKIYTWSPSTAPIAEILVKTLAEVLSIFALVTMEIKQGRLRKFGKTLLGDSEVEDALRRLDKLTEEEHRVVAAQTYSNTVSIKADTRQILDSQDMVKRNGLQSRYRTWLCPPDPSTNHNVACKTRHDSTAAWFIRSKVFEEWKSAGCLLWIHGKLGSGKSVLCSTIIEHLLHLRSDEASAFVAYFYCDFRESSKQSFRGLLSSLVIQSCAGPSNPCLDSLSGLYSAHEDGLRQPSDDVLVGFLKESLTLFGSSPKYIVIDALDECPSLGVSSPREDILRLMAELINMHCSNLFLCITSRPEDDIGTILQPLASHRVSLEDENGQGQDIVRYIRSAIDTHEKMRRWKEKTKNLVIDTLSKNANGMFRYVSCQLDVLCECPPAIIEPTLRTLPRTLYETYEATLRRIDEQKWKHAHRLFQCLSFSARPLRVEELAEVFAVDVDGSIPTLNIDWRWDNAEGAILSTCPGSFVAIVDDRYGDRVAQFAHFSVKEFLTSNRLATSQDGDLSRFHVAPQPSHTFLANACLATLFQFDNGADRGAVQGFPLSLYAAEHLPFHSRHDGVQPRIQDAMDRLFDRDRSHFAAWVWIHDVDRTRDREPGYELSEHPEEPSQTPLYYAASCGLAHVTSRLAISHPDDVHANGGNHGTALHAAAYHGHQDGVQALLDYGADINTQDGHPQRETALQTASGAGQYEVVRLLLVRGADPNAKGGWSGGALQTAASIARLDIMELLLKHGADIDGMGPGIYGPEVHGTALRVAASHKEPLVIRFLLERGANPNAHLPLGGSALDRASFSGILESAKLLLDSGADVNAPGSHDKGAPLAAASYGGHMNMVQLLVEHGADVNLFQCSRFANAMVAAVCKRRLQVVKLLLDLGANIEGDYHEREPFMHQAAPAEVHSGMPDPGPTIPQRPEALHKTPLVSASQLGISEIVRLLLERGANVNALGGKYGTALTAASTAGHFEIMRTLLDHGADVNKQTGCFYGNALQAAAHGGHTEVVRLLLERGADINARGTKVAQSAMEVASAQGHSEVVELLSNVAKRQAASGVN